MGSFIIIIIIYSILLIAISKNLIIEFKKARVSDLPSTIIYSIFAITFTTIFMIALGFLIDRGVVVQTNTSVISENLINNSLIAVLFFVIQAPILEEFFFRYKLASSIMNDYGVKHAIVLSSIIFSLFHLIISNYSIIVLLISFFSRFVLGLILAKCYLKRSSLLSSVIVHSLHNLFIIVLLFSL